MRPSARDRLSRPVLYLALTLAAMAANGMVSAAVDDIDPLQFDDTPLDDLLEYPPWFKQGFLALDEDLEEAVVAGKQGIIVYFGQKRCAYCKMLMDVNFKTPDIVTYTRRHFDVIPIDIWSPEEVTLPSGESLTERQYAQKLGTDFTPSLIFYDAKGRIALRLRGYYPPYQFRAALEYVAGGHYLRRGEVDLCIVGADRIAANGDVANKIGTYQKAVLAKENGVPFYVAAPTSTIDFRCPTGDQIPIEERSPDEVHYVHDGRRRLRVSPRQAQAANPAFDVTPARYVTGILTEFGLFPPAKLRPLRSRVMR